ncbi:MAG TPA: hypothetical protein VGH52_05795 [Gaiellaceae bacterium]|jgi:hypothetical protein
MDSLSRYAVVSCHVERPLDDRVWAAFERLLSSRPGGFDVTPFLRPPAEGEDEKLWLERARHAAALAPLGHHTHWGGIEQARPKGVDPSALVREQADWLRANELMPRYFCGGGWYVDEALAETLAQHGYVDCTATTFQQSYLAADAPRLQLDGPRRLLLGSGATLLELPATHSLGMLGRGLARLRGPVHVHFHDWELAEPRRALAIPVLLRMLRVLRKPLDIDELAERAADAPEAAFAGATIAS